MEREITRSAHLGFLCKDLVARLGLARCQECGDVQGSPRHASGPLPTGGVTRHQGGPLLVLDRAGPLHRAGASTYTLHILHLHRPSGRVRNFPSLPRCSQSVSPGAPEHHAMYQSIHLPKPMLQVGWTTE